MKPLALLFLHNAVNLSNMDVAEKIDPYLEMILLDLKNKGFFGSKSYEEAYMTLTDKLFFVEFNDFALLKMKLQSEPNYVATFAATTYFRMTGENCSPIVKMFMFQNSLWGFETHPYELVKSCIFHKSNPWGANRDK